MRVHCTLYNVYMSYIRMNSLNITQWKTATGGSASIGSLVWRWLFKAASDGSFSHTHFKYQSLWFRGLSGTCCIFETPKASAVAILRAAQCMQLPFFQVAILISQRANRYAKSPHSKRLLVAVRQSISTQRLSIFLPQFWRFASSLLLSLSLSLAVCVHRVWFSCWK